ncbi:hypothetical protein LFML04_1436 [Leptospirillum ferriphilum ML-04]|uniref:Uncharacterized protein n=1 Tax=Leptospirillum ferriphilum (strain ML-04) TaxID=1048260 RepID=J9ZB08_LEPFM|nr:hypothetical protein LFML04_1436 [Leptospirillum ferriphilum ML-04]
MKKGGRPPTPSPAQKIFLDRKNREQCSSPVSSSLRSHLEGLFFKIPVTVDGKKRVLFPF